MYGGYCAKKGFGAFIMKVSLVQKMHLLKQRLETLSKRHALIWIVLSPLIAAYRFSRFISGEVKLSKDRREYKRQCGRNKLFAFHWKNSYPILYDYKDAAGSVTPHYFFQDIFVANQVFFMGIKHIHDIGSRLDGYIAHLLSMGIHVTMIDIRPLSVPIDGLYFLQGNAMSLEGIEDESISCLSCLHALEHFGLGRYGDPIDYEGWRKALCAMTAKLESGGLLFLSVPVGNRDLLMYNAHRIFHPANIYEEVKKELSLLSFTVVRDYTVTTSEFTVETAVEDRLDGIADSLGEYDCGIYIFRKNKLNIPKISQYPQADCPQKV